MNRKRLFLGLAGGLVVLASTVFAVNAQQGGSAPARTPSVRNVAVVDIDYIFKNHMRFQSELDAIRQELKQADAEAQEQQQAIKAMAEELKTLEPGSASYNQLDDRILQARSSFETDIMRKRKQFLLRETKLHYNTYREVMGEIQYYAQNNGIVMVFRFNGDEVDPNVPDDVVRYVNRPIVYHAERLDITPMILQRLNARAQTANSSSSGYQRLPTPNFR